MIEDDPNVAKQVIDALRSDSRYDFFDHCEKATHGLERLVRNPPDLAIVDLGLPDASGLDCIRVFRRDIPDTKILVFTVMEDEENILNAIRLGASGYLLKDTPMDLLLLELQVILMGGASLTPRVAQRMAGHLQNTENEQSPLGNRESEVLHLVALGFTYPDIADEMDITVHTVRRHIERIYRKLDVHSKAEAIIKGRRTGILRKLFD